MKKLPLLLVVAVLSFPTVMLAQAGGSMAAPQTNTPGKATKGEGHPEIHQAMQYLHQAKQVLQQKAARDFGGHRKEAVESIDQAIEHLKQALQDDKK
ncbi:MAG: hypothetical protein WBQ10_14335 [Terriglobales bacterium]